MKEQIDKREKIFIEQYKAVIKEQFKLTIPGGKMENAVLAKFYHLFRDTREEWPLSTEIGAWSSAKMVAMIQRHMARMQKYPRQGPGTGMPYKGIDNLRPETLEIRDIFMSWHPKK